MTASRGGHDEVRHAAQMDCFRSLRHRPVLDNCCGASPAQAYSGSRTRLNALATNNATRSRKMGRDCKVRWSSPDSRSRRSTRQGRNQQRLRRLSRRRCGELPGDMPFGGRPQRSRLFPVVLFGLQHCQAIAPHSFATIEARGAPQSILRPHR